MMSEVEKRITDIVRNNIKHETLTHEIETSGDLEAYGIDSISFIKIVVCIETEFDFEFEDEDLNVKKFPTIKSFVTYVENRSSK